jgi:prevent-host-death family protein
VTPTPIRTFRANLRSLLARAARGEALVVTYRGLPIAEVVPVGTMARLVNTVPPSEP